MLLSLYSVRIQQNNHQLFLFKKMTPNYLPYFAIIFFKSTEIFEKI